MLQDLQSVSDHYALQDNQISNFVWKIVEVILPD